MLAKRAFDLTSLSDAQLATLASMPMSPDQWDLIEEEVARRMPCGHGDWAFDLDGVKTVNDPTTT